MQNPKCAQTNCQLKGVFRHPVADGHYLCEGHLQKYFDAIKEEAAANIPRLAPKNKLQAIIQNRELSFAQKLEQLDNLKTIDI